jgi:hypothetical protein
MPLPSQCPGYTHAVTPPCLALSHTTNGPNPNFGRGTQFSAPPAPSRAPQTSPYSSDSTTWELDGPPQQPFLTESCPENRFIAGSKLHNLSSRQPFRISPDIFVHSPSLRTLTEKLLQESWYINGAPERRISEEEARLRIGPAGKSVFLAFARSTPGDVPRTLWFCLVCEASDGATNPLSSRSTYTREDRILKHIRHHFEHRPWVCSGQCGTGGW